VGHALTVTTLQAGAAAQLLDSDPEFVRRALRAIEDAGRGAMADLDYVLGVLREEPGGPTGPSRTLRDLDRLLSDSQAAGIQISLQVDGPVEALPAAVSREGYRIVQEGLTNAARHAARSPVALRVAALSGSLEIEVVNALPSGPHLDRRGHGLAGMRERVLLLGGELTAGPDGPDFRVTARIPVDR
jgi:signal transduction histidine kinase